MAHISVIIPVYNADKYLSVCIDSVINQTYTDWELILINDGSSDKSGDICNLYAQNNTNIKVFHQPNKGVSAARNLGIKSANGLFIVFMDSDDWIDTDFLQKLIDAEIQTNSNWIISGYRSIYPGNRTKEYRNLNRSYNKSELGLLFAEVDHRGIFFTNCGKLYSKVIITNNNIQFDENVSLGEDIRFNFAYLPHISTATTIDYIGYNYRNTDNHSLIRRYQNNLYNLMIEVHTERCRLAQQYQLYKINPGYKKHLEYRLGHIIYASIINIYHGQHKAFHNRIHEIKMIVKNNNEWKIEPKLCYSNIILFLIKLKLYWFVDGILFCKKNISKK